MCTPLCYTAWSTPYRQLKTAFGYKFAPFQTCLTGSEKMEAIQGACVSRPVSTEIQTCTTDPASLNSVLVRKSRLRSIDFWLNTI